MWKGGDFNALVSKEPENLDQTPFNRHIETIRFIKLKLFDNKFNLPNIIYGSSCEHISRYLNEM